MYRKLLVMLMAVGLYVPASGFFVDDIKLDLKSAKFKEAGSDLLGYNDGEEKLFFYMNGTVEFTAKIPAEGEYTIVISASCTAAQNENAKFKLKADGKDIGKEHTLTSEDQKDYKFDARFGQGDKKVIVTYINDVYKEGDYDRNFYIHAVTLKKK